MRGNNPCAGPFVRLSFDELLAFERSGHIRWIEPKGFSLFGNRLPQVDFLLEFEALSGRTYLCAITKVDIDAVQLDCPAENVSGIWFADITARKEAAMDRKLVSAEDHEIEYLARKHGTTKERVIEIAKKTGSRSREQIAAALDEQFGPGSSRKPAKRAKLETGGAG